MRLERGNVVEAFGHVLFVWAVDPSDDTVWLRDRNNTMLACAEEKDCQLVPGYRMDFAGLSVN